MATTWEGGESHNGCQEWNGRGGEIVEASDPDGGPGSAPPVGARTTRGREVASLTKLSP